ncbi:preprotein translocase subunit SecG [Larkinella soli]|uniref:preprotein translocase subunit SecG n=1 Tax=Larkinella soli TaxID=1770527 RepID=UPI000FFBD405|nr:preprotein translocase subunit SecG [Larkinella soli]
MLTVFIVLICIITVLLILVVLIQNSKGGGLSGEFGGIGSNQLMGVKKTTDLLEQITWGLAIGIMVLTLASYVLVDRSGTGATINSANVDAAASKTVPGAGLQAPAQRPAAGAQQTPAAAPKADSAAK